MTEPRRLDERRARLWTTFLEMQRGLLGALDRQNLRDSGLSGADYSVLAPLSHAPEGLLRARELGSELSWDRSRLSHQVSRMQKRGLVDREDCPTDARGTMVRLTDTGRAAIEEAAPQHVEAVHRYFFDHLTDDELEMLSAVCERVLGGLCEDVTVSERAQEPGR
jgi:DNA-binding MarR family transcriptional regulator